MASFAPAMPRSCIPQPTSFDKEGIKRNAFHDQGIAIVDINDHRLSWDEKELLRRIGERIYGRRRGLRSV